MRLLKQRRAWLGVGAAAVAAVVPIASVSARPARHAPTAKPEIKHVLLISVDGLHQSDLAWYVEHYPHSALAQLALGGREYDHAQTPVPSDSFPGMTAQVTGGDPRTTGVYYDAEYSRAVLPAGTTSCAGKALGAPVTFDESIDRNSNALDAGQGLSGLPNTILQMTGQPQTLINPAALPVDPAPCQPIYPHQYLRVNTIFDVAHEHGLRTAWSDKHPAYDLLNGPSGAGIDDLFTPEINSEAAAYGSGADWTTDNAATMQYDSYKVRAVINELDGYDHSGTTREPVPAILGLNFQTVSTAEKLPTSDGLTGGYLPGTRTPGPLLRRALNYINDKVAAMQAAIRSQDLADSTAIILSAKHGQSPQNPLALTRIDDGPIINGINEGWDKLHPGAPALVAAATDDDAMMMWLSEQTPGAYAFVREYLWSHTRTGNTVSGGSRTLAHSGLEKLYVGPAAARYWGVPVSDTRYPDVWGIVQHGVVYTGATKKIAEHGGANPEDRDVPIVVYAPGHEAGLVSASVETTQIAPTILSLLGLDPRSLQAVRIEHTRVLPGS